MLSLGTVEPDGRRCVGDLHRERPVCDTRIRLGRDKSRPEAILHRLARLCERALSDGVVFGPEAECDGITLSCLEAIGAEDQTTSLVCDGDKVVFRNSGANKGGSSEDAREMHIMTGCVEKRLARLGIECTKRREWILV